jgi:Outer membrane efflux protein
MTMTPFQRRRPLLQRLALAGLFVLPGLSAQAQTVSEALQAADPSAPLPVIATATAPPAPVASPPLPADPAEALKQWQLANQRVAAFPRGHIDILRAEAQDAATPGDPTTKAGPLSADEALRQSLRLKPELLKAPGGSPLAQAERHQALLSHVTGLRRSWMEAVATGEALRLQQARQDTARSGAELGQRMVQAGNWSQARLLREQLAEAREAASLLQAQQAALGAHERLARLLGIWQADAVAQLGQRLPAGLPAPPATLEGGGNDVEARTMAQDAALALQRVDAARDIAATPPAQRAAWERALQESAASLDATTLPATPLILQDARLGKDHALERAMEAEATLLRAAVQRRSAAREAWGRLQAQHALAHQTQAVILPLQVALEQETLLRYNGMLQSTWELLEASRERVAATAAAAQARRDFWFAHLDWQLLLAGGAYQPPGTSAVMVPSGPSPQGH